MGRYFCNAIHGWVVVMNDGMDFDRGEGCSLFSYA